MKNNNNYGRIMFLVFMALLNYKRDTDEHTLYLAGRFLHPCIASSGLLLYLLKLLLTFNGIHKNTLVHITST